MKIDRDNLARFFDRKGFYIVLFLCIVVVAVTAVYVTNSNLKKMADLKTAQEELNTSSKSKSTQDLVTEYPKTPVNVANNKATKEDNKVKVENSITTKTTDAKANQSVMKPDTSKLNQGNDLKAMSNKVETNNPVKSDTTFALTKPVNGDVVMEFAENKLTYSKTLDVWTTHKGIDLKASKGSDVLAAMDGAVSKVYNDSKLGNTVEVKNGSYVTRYSNLDDNIAVKAGQTLKKGQAIGKVGASAKFEIAEDPHVHFELIKDGVYIDPMQYFK